MRMLAEASTTVKVEIKSIGSLSGHVTSLKTKNENLKVMVIELKDSVTYVNYIQKIQRERINELVTIINYEVPAEKLVKLNLQLKRRQRQIDSLIKLEYNLIHSRK